ncbi:serine carboxypeptidase S28 [Nitzschia inconspicua]|uniref:Serine carboxypeptidase S28 n=1 Tax=Nitzschia inconspicua TaxID=303405 RepID=A0A9K3LUV5_9STRA|nr:serine carboxypeptidase S28 [Nitzschia inconspicua]
MTKRLVTWSVLAYLHGHRLVSGLPEMRYRDVLQARNKFVENDLVHRYYDTTNTYSDVQELYMTQPLDHFDATNEATYQQRYFVSYRHDQSSSLPILNLLCVGGEGPGFDKSVLVDSVHCTGDMLEVAKRIASHDRYNVHLYALEHRYYGKSYPTFEDGSSPLTTANLKYHSSLQALEDLAHFVRKINQETNSADATWITFGGSYPGMMALYARYKYPHLIFAAVSSSAPIQAQVDFAGYKARQGWDLAYQKVGGSCECHRIVTVGHEQAVALLMQTNSTDGALELATKFNLCDPSTVLTKRRNQEMFLGDGMINIPAQNNDPSCTRDELCNIEGLCDYMIHQLKMISAPITIIQHDDDAPNYPELEVLAKVSRKQQQFAARRRHHQQHDDNLWENCLSVDFDAMLKEVTNTVVDDFGWRPWLYQTCSEFGFYQTCGDDCPFASHFHKIDMDLEICEKAFNITNVYDNVQATLDRYGGRDIVCTDASRILSINGNVDPWSVLSLSDKDETKYSLPIKGVEGASHHFWTHPVKDTDAPEVAQAREYIYSVVMNWIGMEPDAEISLQQAAFKTSATS